MLSRMQKSTSISVFRDVFSDVIKGVNKDISDPNDHFMFRSYPDTDSQDMDNCKPSVATPSDFQNIVSDNPTACMMFLGQIPPKLSLEYIVWAINFFAKDQVVISITKPGPSSCCKILVRDKSISDQVKLLSRKILFDFSGIWLTSSSQAQDALWRSLGSLSVDSFPHRARFPMIIEPLRQNPVPPLLPYPSLFSELFAANNSADSSGDDNQSQLSLSI